MGALATLFSRIRSVPTGRILGRQSSGTGRAEALTAAELRTLASLYSQAEVDAALSVIESAGIHAVPFLSDADTYLTPLGNSATVSAQALTANRLYHIPFVVYQSRVITTAVVNVTTFDSGSSIRLGIRNVNYPTGQPTTLLSGGDFGAIDSGSNGTKTITGLSVSISRGFYFLQVVSNGVPTISAIANSGVTQQLGTRITAGTATFVRQLYRGFTYGTLPSDDSGSSQTVSNGNALLVGVR